MLVEPNDNVIVLADGRKIDVSGKEVKPKRQMIEIPANGEAQKLVVRANRRIADLPAIPEKLNGTSVILVYSMFGLADQEIALATGLTVEQIETVRMHDSYVTLLEELRKNVIAADQDIIRRTIQQHALNAQNKIVDLMESDDDKTALKASQDVMDRAGYRPADIVEHRHKMEGTLRVVHVEKKSTENMPIIDVFGEKNGESS
jgi:predicted DNA-binding protein (UPF0251 family)